MVVNSKNMVCVELNEDGYGYLETEDGWFACDMFGLINTVGLPTKFAAETYLRFWILSARKAGRAS